MQRWLSIFLTKRIAQILVMCPWQRLKHGRKYREDFVNLWIYRLLLGVEEML
jgi:hypothetical protein